MKIKIISLALLISTVLFSCRKEYRTKLPKTTQEKLLGKWPLVSELTNSYYNGAAHFTTYLFSPQDYHEFSADGKMTEYKSGVAEIYDYGIASDSRIWINIGVIEFFDIRTLTDTDLQLYRKTEYSSNEYYESTLSLRK